MDAQNRGQADEIDPADQWVLNPRTGNYELRLDHSGGQSPPVSPSPGRSSGRRGSAAGTPAAGAPREGRPGTGGPRRGGARQKGSEPDTDTAPARPDVPGQRGSRRAGKGPAGGRGPANETQAAAGRRKRKQKKSRTKKVLLWTGGSMAVVVLAASVGGYLYYQHLNGNISTIDVAGASDKGFEKDKPINILVIGTDKRTGDGNESYGDSGSVGHADTTLLFHVSKDRTNATALSIPRDLVTDIPECTTKTADGSDKVIPATPRGVSSPRFNTSLGQDGRDPGCTMATVKELTGITPDHFMMADFNAVKTMSTAVGGVEVCVDQAVKDKDSKLDLPAGKSTISGEQALAFVRTRHAFGDGSDLTRIKTQQQFLSSLLRQMASKDTLTNVSKVTDLAEAATKSLTVDSGIGSITKLVSLAKELAKVNPKNITFATIPVLDNPAEPPTRRATVVVNEAPAQQLFSMILSDTSLSEVKKKESAAKSAKNKLLKGSKADAADVRVDVYNGGGPQGSAQTTLNWLQNEEGVLKSTNKGNAPANVAKTTLVYAPNQADQARALAAMMGLPGTAMKPGTEDAVGLQAMELTLGKDFKGAGVPITGPAKAPDAVPTLKADKQVCAE
ncbi:LCP family protein [Streptomyces sp. SID1121]|uniref:LCP family protein n=1 Tax=Streptomyces sp. SID1121 TaxID=3425888 RepID=UPI004056C733